MFKPHREQPHFLFANKNINVANLFASYLSYEQFSITILNCAYLLVTLSIHVFI